MTTPVAISTGSPPRVRLAPLAKSSVFPAVPFAAFFTADNDLLPLPTALAPLNAAFAPLKAIFAPLSNAPPGNDVTSSKANSAHEPLPVAASSAFRPSPTPTSTAPIMFNPGMNSKMVPMIDSASAINDNTSACFDTKFLISAHTAESPVGFSWNRFRAWVSITPTWVVTSVPN